MSFKYRPQRGGLQESLKEEVELKDFTELLYHLEKTTNWLLFTSAVKVEKYGVGIDERCGYDTHIVTVNGNIEGFTNKMVKRKG